MSEAKKVLVGMSGGIDSTVAALLLRDAGYEPSGVTLVLKAKRADDAPGPAECGYAAAAEAAEAARRLGIPHETVDAREAFTRDVLGACWDVFAAGGTPNPCVFCNARVRFLMMRALAERRGADFIATGHYARIVSICGALRLARGADPRKDQSYFLYGVPAALYPHILFPLGGLEKTEVRAIARRRGLANAESPESQDVCFAGPDGQFAEKLRQLVGGRAIPGVFKDESGKILGSHSGIHQFTIGQRKGLGFAVGAPVKICAIDPATGDITVSARPEAAYGSAARAENFRWLAEPPAVGAEIAAQVRYRQKPSAAIVAERDVARGTVAVRFAEPVFGITRGQSLVLYDGTIVIGGGVIC